MPIKAHGQRTLADYVTTYENLERCVLVCIELHHLRISDEMRNLPERDKEVHQVHVLRNSPRSRNHRSLADRRQPKSTHYER